MIKLIGWTDYKTIQENKKIYASLPSSQIQAGRLVLWDYIHELDDDFVRKQSDYIEDAIIKELIENQYIICGDTHQLYAIPVFEGGYVIYSMRKWGEIMNRARCMVRFNNVDNYYLATLCETPEKLPKITAPHFNSNNG